MAMSDDSHGLANWSEMGCKKTSTGLWLIQRLMDELNIENPSVLILTTRSGKGTFYKLAPHILEGWMIFDVNSQHISVIENGKAVRVPPSKMKHLPLEINFPCIVLSHYQIFSRSNHGIPKRDKKGEPKRDADGAIIFEEPTQA